MAKKRTLDEIRPLLKRLKEILKNNYQDLVQSIVLYGSFARNQADEDSDIDLAIIMCKKVDNGKETDRIHDLIYDIELETGELISIKPVFIDDLKRSRWPLYQHIREEGIII